MARCLFTGLNAVRAARGRHLPSAPFRPGHLPSPGQTDASEKLPYSST